MSDPKEGACGAKTRSGAPCRRPGKPRCWMHGGAAPQVIAKREREEAEQKLRDEVARLLDDPSAPPVTDPQERLAALAGRLEHALNEVGSRVSALSSLGIVTGAGGQQVRAEVRVWTELVGHLTRALDVLMRAGYSERRLALAEQHAEAWGRYVSTVLDAAGVQDDGARQAGLDAGREQLRLILGAA